MTETAQHTPGPWLFVEDGDTESEYNRGRQLTIVGPEADLANVFSADDSTVGTSRATAIANARLIAAAPDLLVALRSLTNGIGGIWRAFEFDIRPAISNTNYQCVLDKIESATAALAKAEGRS